MRRQDANHWQVLGKKFPVDTGSVQQFIQTQACWRVAEFVKDVVTPPDFHRYGLSRAARQITLFAASHGTNIVTAQLFFGLKQTNRVFVRGAGDDPVYGITPGDFNRLPPAGWESATAASGISAMTTYRKVPSARTARYRKSFTLDRINGRWRPVPKASSFRRLPIRLFKAV